MEHLGKMTEHERFFWDNRKIPWKIPWKMGDWLVNITPISRLGS